MVAHPISRPISDLNVTNLMKKIKESGFRCITEFTVSQVQNADQYRVIDGNHRFRAIQRLELEKPGKYNDLMVKCSIYKEPSEGWERLLSKCKIILINIYFINKKYLL